MSDRSVVLTDVAREVWTERFGLSAGDGGVTLAGSDAWSISKRTLRGGSADGVDVVEIDNGRLAVSVLPTRGMGLWRGRCDGMDLGWDSPVAHPVHPRSVNLTERNGLGWLAGFNEWLCRCGLAWHGPPGSDGDMPLTLHGKIANTPAHRVEVQVSSEGDGLLRVVGVVDEASLFGPRLRLTSTLETVAGSNRLVIEDEVTNLAGQPAEFQMLYHLNIGRPLLEPGARLLIPARQVAPRDAVAAGGIDAWTSYGDPAPGYREQVFYVEPAADAEGGTLALLVNAAGDRGLSVRFDRRQLPCFALWKNTQAEADGYVTGLEPATSFPNFKPFEREQGRVIVLPPGGSYRLRLELSVHTTPAEVTDTERRIAVLQGDTPPHIHPHPQPGFSPG